MFKPFFNRKYQLDPTESNDWLFWRWFDIIGQEDQGKGLVTSDTVYLRRLYIVRCPWFSIMLHRIFLPDPDRHHHDHPWDFLSILVRGWYVEERPIQPEGAGLSRVRIRVKRRWFNWCRAEGAHKITEVSPDCISLVITGPKRRPWGFHTPRGWVAWKEYIYGPPKPASTPKAMPYIKISPPYPRPWSPCDGPGCTHESHGAKFDNQGPRLTMDGVPPDALKEWRKKLRGEGNSNGE